METKTRIQGNALTLTVPKSFKLRAGVTVEPELQKDGIFYRFVQADNFFDFDEEILRELIAEGLSGEALIDAFKRQKSRIPQAVETLKQETQTLSPMTKEELANAIGL